MFCSRPTYVCILKVYLKMRAQFIISTSKEYHPTLKWKSTNFTNCFGLIAHICHFPVIHTPVFTSSSFCLEVFTDSQESVDVCDVCSMWTTGINFHNFQTHDVFFIHVSAVRASSIRRRRIRRTLCCVCARTQCSTWISLTT